MATGASVACSQIWWTAVAIPPYLALASVPEALDANAQLPGVNYLGGSRQLRRRVPPLSPPAMAGGGDTEN